MKRTTIKDTKDRARNKSVMVEIKTAADRVKPCEGKLKVTNGAEKQDVA